MENTDINHITALINLLDDDDVEVWETVYEKITSLGPVVIPQLEKSWENSINVRLQERIENIIQQIQFDSICTDIHNWELAGSNDLIKGACIVARIQFPELKEKTLYDAIEKIKNDIWPNLTQNYTPLEQARMLNHTMFEIHKYIGNHSNYYAPQNYFLNQVIESKKGNPVSLGIIYISIANLVGIPIYGINLPKNFILGYKDINAQSKNESILFYINPFNKGAIIGKREIDFFLEQQKITPHESFFFPCSNTDIIERLIRNLINSYESLNQPDKVEKLNKMISVLRRER